MGKTVDRVDVVDTIGRYERYDSYQRKERDEKVFAWVISVPTPLDGGIVRAWNNSYVRLIVLKCNGAEAPKGPVSM